MFLEKNLLEAYIDLAHDIMAACNLSEKVAEIPMQVNAYVIIQEQYFSLFT
jgi:hypothetical protein